MGAEVVEGPTFEALASSWPGGAAEMHKSGGPVIHMDAIEALLDSQGELKNLEGPPDTRSTSTPADEPGPRSCALRSEVASEMSDDAPQVDTAIDAIDQLQGDVHPDTLSEPASEAEEAKSDHEASACSSSLKPSTPVVEPSDIAERAAARAKRGGRATPAGHEQSYEVPPTASSSSKAVSSSSERASLKTSNVCDDKGPKKKVLFNASHSDYEVVQATAEFRGWKVVKQEDRAGGCNVHWIDDSGIGDWLRRIEPWMRVNHFPGMNNALARKSRLARNMSRMMRSFPESYRFIPPTWVLPDDVSDLTRRMEGGAESKAIYIVKPDHLCQGKGIFLTTDVERIKKVAADSREKDMAVVVQRYITRPMLIDGLKFDLRLYLLVTGVLGRDGSLEPRYFLFRDGLVRLCTTPYEAPTPETFENRRMHLTNYAINKNSKDFQQSTGTDDGSGNKRSLRWFMNYVKTDFGEKESKKLWQKLMGLCAKTLLTVHSNLEAEYSSTFPKDLSGGQMGCRCFEVLGVDVMLDAKMKPYLIEVNHLPSFTCDSPLDEDIKSRLLKQVMDLTCSSISAKDKRIYEQFAKDRREASTSGTTSQPHAADIPPSTDSSLLEQVEYEDFERCYPPPASCPKLAAQCEAILARVRDIFRPAQARRPRQSQQDTSEAGQQSAARPPLAPRATAATAPTIGSAPPRPPAYPPASASSAATRPALAASSSEPPRAPTQSESVATAATTPTVRRIAAAIANADQTEPGRPGVQSRKPRSRSAPGPRRCALPPIARFSSPRPARHMATSPEAAAAPKQAIVRVPSRQRVFLPLKSAQILL